MNSEFEGAPIQPPQKSTFVNVLSWIFIVLGGFATFMSILQNIMIHTLFPKEEMNQVMNQAENAEHLPAFFVFMFNNFNLFFIFFFIVSAVSLIAAIALLKRKNWARILFIILMSIGIAWNMFGLIIQFTMYNSMPEFVGAQSHPPEFENMLQIMKVASIIMVVAVSSLFAFIIKKLCSKSIKAEFT